MSTARKVNPEHPGMAVLRNVLRRLRSDEQDGYQYFRGDGRWDFISTGLPQVTPEELNTLMDLAGVVPDKIEPKGDCEDCQHSVYNRHSGHLEHSGWAKPCCGCAAPRMTNFVPLSSLSKKATALSKDPDRLHIQRMLLQNAMDRSIWWAEGLVSGKQFDAEWKRTMAACNRERKYLIARKMIRDSVYGGGLTAVGLRAFKENL